MTDEGGREILVGYDGSECADAALDAAIELAEAFGDRIVLIFGAAPGGYGGGEIPAHREAVEELGRKELERGKARAAGRGVEVDTELVAKRPAHALYDAAADRPARMIVVGTYSETPLKGAILGSTPHKLLALSELPVLVVPVARQQQSPAS
jgi:nucleotide-binding universal stress UspA family protein